MVREGNDTAEFVDKSNRKNVLDLVEALAYPIPRHLPGFDISDYCPFIKLVGPQLWKHEDEDYYLGVREGYLCAAIDQNSMNKTSALRSLFCQVLDICSALSIGLNKVLFSNCGQEAILVGLIMRCDPAVSPYLNIDKALERANCLRVNLSLKNMELSDTLARMHLMILRIGSCVEKVVTGKVNEIVGPDGKALKVIYPPAFNRPQ